MHTVENNGPDRDDNGNNILLFVGIKGGGKNYRNCQSYRSDPGSQDNKCISVNKNSNVQV